MRPAEGSYPRVERFRREQPAVPPGNELAGELYRKGLTYAINLLALSSFGYSLGVEVGKGEGGEPVGGLRIHHYRGGVILEEADHRMGLDCFNDKELAALTMGVREAEARLTRELERRKAQRALASQERFL